MSVTDINGWRLPGCTDECWPRSHNPESHEQYGRILEREAQFRARDIRTGPLAVNLTDGTACVHGVEIALSQREWELLAYLAERIGQWCPTREIYAAIWGDEVSTFDRSHNVNVTRYRLRARLGPDACELIVTDQTRGTRLALVEVIP